MSFQITAETRTAGGRESSVYVLATEDSSALAEVWPGHGFNCLRWRAAGRELLFVHPDWESTAVPTRSGVPVLFPFPNRIRDGKFSFEGKDYELPLNDSTKANAIHGFAPRNAWRYVGQETDEHGAEVTAEFHLSVDAPESLELWPGDCSLRLTYRLERNLLRLTSLVKNHAEGPVPFGVGFHPYFRSPGGDPRLGLGMLRVDDCVLHSTVAHEWETEDSIPTGKKVEPPAERDLPRSPTIGETVFDHFFTDLEPGANPAAPRRVASLSRTGHGSVELWADHDFGELVVFTPPHREAIALEPYTCAADAVNLTDRGIDCGWRVLRPGETWRGEVEFRFVPDGTAGS